MQARLAHAALAVLVAVFAPACGTGGLPHTSEVTISVTPSQTTIQAGSSIALLGDAKGFSATPIVQWWIQESHDTKGANDCGYLSNQVPPQTGCPYGYVVYDAVAEGVPSAATYHAPLTAGTYHVTFTATQLVEFDSLSKTVQATITVQ
jgi:hypothetical protein